MLTFGIKTDITMSTDKTRSNYASFYKSFSQSKLTLDSPISIIAGESETYDISNSSFVLIISDDYGLENKVLDLTLTDTLANTFTVKNVGFLLQDFTNLTTLVIKNTGSSDIDVNVIY